MAHLPALCSSCGAILPASGIRVSNVEKLTISNVRVQCRYCGGMADVFDGTMEVTDNAIKLLQSGNVSQALLERLRDLAKEAYEKKTDVDTFAKRVEEIHPSLGTLVRNSKGRMSFPSFLLILIFLITQSCTMNVSVDANKLLDQMMNKSPDSLIHPDDLDKEDEGSGTDSTKHGPKGQSPPQTP